MQNLSTGLLSSPARQRIIVVALAFLYAASFAPVAWWPAQFLALAFLQYFVLGAADQSKPVLHASTLGLLFGFVAYGSGITWAYDALHLYSGQSPPVAFLFTLVFAAYLSAFVVLPAACAAWVKKQTSSDVPALAVFYGVWLLGEWLRSQFWGGYTLEAIGYAHVESWLSGYAPVVGVYGLSLIGLFVSTAVLCVLFHVRLMYRATAALALAVVLGLGILLSNVEWTSPAGSPLKVRLLQGNVTQVKKFDEASRYVSLDIYKKLITEEPADLIVTPETALPLFLDEMPGDYFPDLMKYAEATQSALIVGIPVASEGAAYDSMLTIQPNSRAVGMTRYDKVHLSPVGEYTPLGLGWFTRGLTIPLKDFSPGNPSQPMVQVKDQMVGITICHEDLFGEEMRQRLKDATVLINASNLAWFEGSVAFRQRTQASQMRALEMGRPVLRVTNTGTTALIDVKGHISQQLPDFREGALGVEVHGYRGVTPYVAWGNTPVWMLAVFFCLGAMLHLIPRYRCRAGQAQQL
jgi:apolipoprotein N-acyltransferase